MFDTVRIRAVPETEALGVAGLTGSVHGQTTPSDMGVSVIGDSAEDYAINVYFDDREEGFWFAPHLVEFVDHAPGTEIGIGDRRWVRAADGRWLEQPPERLGWLARLLRRQ